MKTHVTLFSNVKSSHGVPAEGSWEELISGPIAPMSEPPAFELWTPASLKDDRRLAENVHEVFALVLDFDGKHHDPEWIAQQNKQRKENNPNAKTLAVQPGSAVTIEEALKRWGTLKGWWHFTRSHKDAHHSFRIVIPLVTPVSAADHGLLCELAHQRETGLCPDSTMDKVTKDPARLWFLPEHDGQWNETEGEHLTEDIWNSWDVQEEEEQFEPPPANVFDPLAGPDGDNESRIAAYLASMPPSIEGEGGSTNCFNAARKIRDIGVEDPERIAELLAVHFNPRCEPPWSAAELLHKAKEAIKSKVRNPVQEPTPPSPPPAVNGYQPRPATEVFGPLLTDKEGKTLNKYINYNHLIHNSFGSSIRYDEFTDKIRVVSSLPWGDPAPRDLTDVDGIMMCGWLESIHRLGASPDKAYTAMLAVAHMNKFDSYREHIESMPAWDNVPRLDTWLSTYMGATATPYTAAVGRAFLIAMMARALTRGGVEVHNVLVLEGDQGIGKSRSARIIAGSNDWFSSAIPDLQSKDAAISIQGKAIVELAELAAMKRSNNESAKEFLARSTDKFRPPYGRGEVTKDRRCVFIATTNHSNYLTDETGNRRYWPVRCSSKADSDLLTRERNQLIAEAKVAFEQGEKWYGPHLDKVAFGEQRSRTEADPWDDELDRYIVDGIRRFTCPRSKGDFISTDELLAKFGVDMDKRTTSSSQRIARMMRSRGWSDYRTQVQVNSKKIKARGYTITCSQEEKMAVIAASEKAQEAMSGADYDASSNTEEYETETVTENKQVVDISRYGRTFNQPKD